MNNTCPICQNTHNKPEVAKVTICPDSVTELIACPQCQCRYFSTMPTDQQLARFYNQAFYENFDHHKLMAKGRYFAKWLSRLKSGGRFLDVGCSTSHFIHGINSHCDWQVYGTEIDPQMVEYAKQQFDIDVRLGELDQVNYPDEFFDVIHVGDVLEHVRDPITFLQACKRYLKPDGLFYLAIPNGYVDAKEIIRYSQQTGQTAFSPKGHLYFFYPETLDYLFNRFDFHIKQSRTYGLKNGLRSLGLLPAKSNWQSHYIPQFLQQDKRIYDINHAQPRTPQYYDMRFKMKSLMRLPGAHRFGLDFIFILNQ